MQLKPPTRYISYDAKKFQRYHGRVHEVRDGCLSMTIWEWFGDRKGHGREFFSNVSMSHSQITLAGKFSCGTPVEIWAWKESDNDRVHVASMD